MSHVKGAISSMWRLHLLGDLRLYCDEKPVSSTDTPRLQSVLAYLVLHRHAPQQPSHLAFLPCSQLCTMPLWREPLGSGKTEWRGKVQCVTSGEKRYFRDWAAPVPALLEMLKIAAI